MYTVWNKAAVSMLQQLVYNQPVPCPVLQHLASESYPCPIHCNRPLMLLLRRVFLL